MRKSSFPAGRVHPDWRESAAFSPIYLRTGVSAAVAATWRPSAAASFYTSWHRPCGASRGYFAQKRPSERAKSCVFSTIICKGGFPFLRYVSAGAAATFFAAFVPWPVFCFAKLHCFAAASFSSICIYSFLSVCFMSADVGLIWPRMLPPPFRAARSAYVQVPPESVWSKGKALFAGRAFFRCPVRSKQKFRRSDTPEAAGNGWR